MCVGDGKITDFWRDPWYGKVSLIDKFPDIFNICNETDGSVAEFASNNWALTFKRWLDERQQVNLRKMRDTLTACAVSIEKDRPKWVGEKMVALQSNLNTNCYMNMRLKTGTKDYGSQSSL